MVVARTYRLGPARKAVNTAVTALLRVGVGGRASRLLTTTGRRSGRPRTTPVVLVQDQGGQWLVSPYGQVGWVHNVRAAPRVTLRRGRHTVVLDAHEVDAQTAGPVLQRYLRDTPVTAPFFDAVAGDPVRDFVAEAARHPVFTLTAPIG